MAVTTSDVEDLSAKGWNALESTKKQALLDIAEREKNTIYSARVSTFPTLEGSEDDFVAYLTAHKWTLAEGGEAQSESGSGGSVSYNTVTGESKSTLTQTRYGQEALRYLRDGQGVGIVRTR